MGMCVFCCSAIPLTLVLILVPFLIILITVWVSALLYSPPPPKKVSLNMDAILSAEYALLFIPLYICPGLCFLCIRCCDDAPPVRINF